MIYNIKGIYIIIHMMRNFLIEGKRPPISSKTMVCDMSLDWVRLGVILAEMQVPRHISARSLSPVDQQ